MPDRQPYSSREADEAAEMLRAGGAVSSIQEVPSGLASAIAHALYAAATELSNGRILPVEVLRAAMHLIREVDRLQP